MSNIENIKNKIAENANDKIFEINEESKRISDEIFTAKSLEAGEMAESIVQRAKREAELQRDGILSRATLASRDELLGVKQDIMDDVFDKAKANLEVLDDANYIKFFGKTISGIELKDNMEFVIPKKYVNAIKAEYPKLKISEEITDSGFMIYEGNIMLNYNFNDLIDYRRDELESEIVKILFDEQE